jgi:hypothetical protein
MRRFWRSSNSCGPCKVQPSSQPVVRVWRYRITLCRPFKAFAPVSYIDQTLFGGLGSEDKRRRRVDELQSNEGVFVASIELGQPVSVVHARVQVGLCGVRCPPQAGLFSLMCSSLFLILSFLDRMRCLQFIRGPFPEENSDASKLGTSSPNRQWIITLQLSEHNSSA